MLHLIRHICFVFAALVFLNQPISAQSIDNTLRGLLEEHEMAIPDAGGGHSERRIALGQALFFDRELSGNRDTSCATCHHPSLASGDGLALPVGTAPENPGALSSKRRKGHDREFIPRNAPEIFNRGSSLWRSMFWDSRVAEDDDGNFTSPAGDQLLDGLTSSLYIQAMFPVTSRDEMRGRFGDKTFQGDVNEIALIDDDNLPQIWKSLTDRLLEIPEYRKLFKDAFPDTAIQDMTFANAANAIGAFEIDAFTFLDSPFDRYLGGDNSALTNQQKKGAMLFYGKANCAYCHAGPLMTDQKHWSLAVPQLGPGKSVFPPYDFGRFSLSLDPADAFAFRTPPLRNVEKTDPYMHNGAYKDLRSTIRHHIFPVYSLLTYRPHRQLKQRQLWSTELRDPTSLALLIASLDWQNLPPMNLKNNEITQMEAFLKSLTAPDFKNRMDAIIPASVPSGLPVETK